MKAVRPFEASGTARPTTLRRTELWTSGAGSGYNSRH